MTTSPTSATSAADREVVITRVVNAPRHLIWKAWTTPGHIEKWWGPNGFTTTTHAISVKEGGVWSYTMHGPDGTDYPNRITYRELLEPERIAYLHDSGFDNDPNAFESTITFEAQGDRTLVTLRSVFATAERRAFVVKKYGAIEGGKQHLARLEAFILASNDR